MTFATSIWPGGAKARAGRLLAARFVLVCCLWTGWSGFAAAEADGAAQAWKNFIEARSLTEKDPQNAALAWQFARACFDCAEFATNNAERARIAEQGIAASRQAVADDTNSAPAHYYLGMNFGQLARTRGLSALKLVDRMETEFLAARRLDEHLDFAGPDRNLGLLYRDAPAFGSIGSRTKAHRHLDRAVALAPEYPENRLALIEALLKWGDRVAARRELKALREVLPAARAALVAPAWASSWTDWDAQLDKFSVKIEGPPVAIQSPRHNQ
jgi:tetratricopeptide (TPR) repeat protein